jgi:transposase-like protein
MHMTESRIGTTSWQPPRDRRRWTLGDGRALVAALRTSRQTAGDFAREHGIHEERVRRWVRRVEQLRAAPALAAAPAPLAFAPVRLVERAEPECAALEVAVGGAVIRVRHGFDEALFGRVVAALGGGRC